jgi:hypothetical protein
LTLRYFPVGLQPPFAPDQRILPEMTFQAKPDASEELIGSTTAMFGVPDLYDRRPPNSSA